jgi:hypothetical protein
VRTDGRVGRVLALLSLGASIAGCGYSLGSNLPSHLRTVAVPIFVHRTQEPAVEDLITQGITDAFTTSGRLRVVRAQEADTILDGEVIGYQLQPLALDEAANVREYRLVVRLNLRFRDVKQNAVLLQESGVEEKADFRSAEGLSGTIAREEVALRQAAVEIGRAVVTRALTQF